jgi:hypothetical protein
VPPERAIGNLIRFLEEFGPFFWGDGADIPAWRKLGVATCRAEVRRDNIRAAEST